MKNTILVIMIALISNVSFAADTGTAGTTGVAGDKGTTGKAVYTERDILEQFFPVDFKAVKEAKVFDTDYMKGKTINLTAFDSSKIKNFNNVPFKVIVYDKSAIQAFIKDTKVSGIARSVKVEFSKEYSSTYYVRITVVYEDMNVEGKVADKGDAGKTGDKVKKEEKVKKDEKTPQQKMEERLQKRLDKYRTKDDNKTDNNHFGRQN
jgi:hypothetical protein